GRRLDQVDGRLPQPPRPRRLRLVPPCLRRRPDPRVCLEVICLSMLVRCVPYRGHITPTLATTLATSPTVRGPGGPGRGRDAVGTPLTRSGQRAGRCPRRLRRPHRLPALPLRRPARP